MNNDLRNRLGRRLAYVYRKVQGYSSPEVHWGDRGEPTREDLAIIAAWNFVADECIRQMEWASRETPGRLITEPIDCREYPGMMGIRILGTHPLTIAPEFWRP